MLTFLLPLFPALCPLPGEEMLLAEAQQLAGQWEKVRAVVGPGVRFCFWFERELCVCVWGGNYTAGTANL